MSAAATDNARSGHVERDIEQVLLRRLFFPALLLLLELRLNVLLF